MKVHPIACMLVLALAVPIFADEEVLKEKEGRQIYMSGVANVTDPRLIEKSKTIPRYPGKALRQGKNGRVILQAVVEPDGRVTKATVIRCKPTGLGFEESAIEAVKKWRYKPAKKDGIPVPVYFTVVIDFSLHLNHEPI